MNWLKRKALELFYSPELPRVIEAAGGIRRAANRISLSLELEARAQASESAERAELQEASQMLTGPGSVAAVALSESGTVDRPLKERFWELELALEDRGWQRQLAISQLEFSRYGIQQLILISRLYFIKNPLIRRVVKLSQFYVFGRGIDISADNDTANTAVQRVLEANKKELGIVALADKEQTLKTDGNLYWAFFTNANTGEVNFRTIDAIEIQEIITDPNDASAPWYYLRFWEQKVFDPASGQIAFKPAYAWYPALNFEPKQRPAQMRGYTVLWDVPIYHRKVGGLPKWAMGLPEVYAEIDWARAAKKHMEDWASITESLRRFSWKIETQGGQQAIQNLSTLLSTTLGNGGTQIETNPPANVASTFVTGQGNKLDPIKTAGAVSSPADVRYLIHMVSAASGMSEPMLTGNADAGSLATATTLDRPTELQYLMRQELWREDLQTILSFALSRGVKAPNGKLRAALRDSGVDVEALVIREAQARIERHGNQWVRVWEKAPKSKNTITIKVDFPAILEHDINARIGAIVEAMTLNGFEVSGIDEKTAVGMLLAELGYETWPELIEDMYPATGAHKYDPDRTEVLAASKDATLNPPIPPQGVTGPQGTDAKNTPPQAPGPKKPRVKRIPPPKEAAQAVDMLRRVLVKLKERAA